MTTAEAAKVTGATERELQLWDEAELIGIIEREPGVCGYTKRVWSATNLRMAHIVKCLKDGGLHPDPADMRVISHNLLSHRWIMFDDRRRMVAASNNRREILKAGAACAGPVVLVEMPL